MAGYQMQSQNVLAMGTIHMAGNVIPPSWFQQLTLPNGKPNLPAIIILSDIVYWFRPIEVRDETTGRPRQPRQKFQADKLQMSYSAWAEMFGFGKDQVRAACHYLEEKGLISIEYRTIEPNGVKCNNVTFFDINPAEIYRITHPESTVADTPIVFHGERVSCFTPTPSLVSRGEAIGFHGETNTKTSSETTTERDERPESASKPKLALVSSVGENPHFADQPFSPNDDFSQAAPRQEWTVGERFVLKACGLWDDLANQEKPIVETSWKTKQAVQSAGKYVAARLNVKQRIGGTPKMFLEFWHDELKRLVTPRPDYVVEQWEAYDRWLIANYETHRRIAA